MCARVSDLRVCDVLCSRTKSSLCVISPIPRSRTGLMPLFRLHTQESCFPSHFHAVSRVRLRANSVSTSIAHPLPFLDKPSSRSSEKPQALAQTTALAYYQVRRRTLPSLLLSLIFPGAKRPATEFRPQAFFTNFLSFSQHSKATLLYNQQQPPFCYPCQKQRTTGLLSLQQHP